MQSESAHSSLMSTTRPALVVGGTFIVLHAYSLVSSAQPGRLDGSTPMGRRPHRNQLARAQTTWSSHLTSSTLLSSRAPHGRVGWMATLYSSRVAAYTGAQFVGAQATQDSPSSSMSPGTLWLGRLVDISSVTTSSCPHCNQLAGAQATRGHVPCHPTPLRSSHPQAAGLAEFLK